MFFSPLHKWLCQLEWLKYNATDATQEYYISSPFVCFYKCLTFCLFLSVMFFFFLSQTIRTLIYELAVLFFYPCIKFWLALVLSKIEQVLYFDSILLFRPNGPLGLTKCGILIFFSSPDWHSSCWYIVGLRLN